MMQPHYKHQQHLGAFEVNLVPESRLTDDRFMRSDRLFAVIRYGVGNRELLSPPFPSVLVPMSQLNEQSLAEVWTSPTPVVVGRYNELHYATNEQVFFGLLKLDVHEDISLETLAYNAYKDIFRLVEKEGYPALLRMWNYMWGINEDHNGLERYRRFCVGRHAAFAELNPEFEKALPAGSGVGTQGPGLTIYFIAARAPGVPLENPRQANAYHYPPQYGPRSPSFSRAMIKEWGPRCDLFLSGTASIVNHETRHVGDAPGQLAETLRNIRALLAHASEVTGKDFQAASVETILKVYITHDRHLSLVQQALAQEFGERVPFLYLNADLCRRELLVEIEGIFKK